MLIEPAANIALLRKMARDLLKKFSTEQKRAVVKIQALARGVGAATARPARDLGPRHATHGGWFLELDKKN